MKQIKKLNKDNYLLKGFSLVELMMSMIVISALCAAFIPIVSKHIEYNKNADSLNELTSECTNINRADGTFFDGDCTLCNRTKNTCIMCEKKCGDNAAILDTCKCP